MPAAPAATPVNPSAPAMSAMIAKMMAHLSWSSHCWNLQAMRSLIDWSDSRSDGAGAIGAPRAPV